MTNFVEKTLPNLFVKIGDTVCADTYRICTVCCKYAERTVGVVYQMKHSRKLTKKLDRKQ